MLGRVLVALRRFGGWDRCRPAPSVIFVFHPTAERGHDRTGLETMPFAQFGTLGFLGGLLLAAVVIYGCELRRLQGTTLRGPLHWWFASVLAVGFVELGLGWHVGAELSVASAWRYVAAVLTFCPTLSLLGAKRPQDQGWHFIVFTLWVVLALPAAQLGFDRSTEVEPPIAWRLLMWTLLAIAVANSLGTRLWPAACLWAAAQWLLLYAAGWVEEFQRNGGLLAATEGTIVISGLSGLVLTRFIVWLKLRVPSRAAGAFDRVWLDFRDQVGVLWSLRVAERVNFAGQQQHWPVVLHWSGLRRVDPEDQQVDENGKKSPETLDATLAMDATQRHLLERNFRNLLRRFVSDAWIDVRLQPGAASRSPPVLIKADHDRVDRDRVDRDRV